MSGGMVVPRRRSAKSAPKKGGRVKQTRWHARFLAELRREEPERLDICFTLLVDESGSMNRESKYLAAREATVFFAEVLDRVEVPFEVTLRGRFDAVFNVTDCRLQSPLTNRILKYPPSLQE